MAYLARNLSVLAYAQGFTLWHYRGAGDSISDVAAGAFFAEAADLLAGGDIVLASAADGGRLLFAHSDRGRIRTSPLDGVPPTLSATGSANAP